MNNSEPILKPAELILLYCVLVLTYVAGLFYPLLEGDSSLHASMAMRLYLENDFLHLIKNDLPYLDKPHLHFWLAALAFKIGGISDIAYRTPSVLMLFLGAFSTFKLGTILYKNTQIGHASALIFLSAQTIILSGHDVRTDAVLTGATILGLWQVIAFIQSGKISNAIWGGLGVALAFSSKGLLGVVVVGICVFFYLLASKEWLRFFNAKFFWLLGSFVLFITPVLYAYYVQYDLNPQQVVEGQTNVSGVKFILWDQSFNRLTATGFQVNRPSYSFFFHTLLWAFLPFSLIAYFGAFQNTYRIFKDGLKQSLPADVMLTGGFWGVMGIISLSKFKLPHYVNSLIPIISILTAAYLYYLWTERKTKLLKGLTVVQFFIIFLEVVIALLIIYFAFPISNYFAFGITCVSCVYFLIKLSQPQGLLSRLLFVSIFFAATFNLFLNTQLYAQLHNFQVGDLLTPIVKEKGVPVEEIVVLEDNYSWKLDFNLQHNIPVVSLNELPSARGKWLLINDENLPQLQEKGITWGEKLTVEKASISKLKVKLLNRATRAEQLTQTSLILLD